MDRVLLLSYVASPSVKTVAKTYLFCQPITIERCGMTNSKWIDSSSPNCGFIQEMGRLFEKPIADKASAVNSGGP